MVLPFTDDDRDFDGDIHDIRSVTVIFLRKYSKLRTPAGGYPKKLQVPEGLIHVPITQVARAHLNTIMSNPESRRIFYFLVLNLAYMMIQMLYGIWTNSLGLISDGMWVRVAVSSRVNVYVL